MHVDNLDVDESEKYFLFNSTLLKIHYSCFLLPIEIKKTYYNEKRCINRIPSQEYIML